MMIDNQPFKYFNTWCTNNLSTHLNNLSVFTNWLFESLFQIIYNNADDGNPPISLPLSKNNMSKFSNYSTFTYTQDLENVYLQKYMNNRTCFKNLKEKHKLHR